MSERKAIEVITNPIIKKHAKYSEDDDLYYISEVHIELLVSEIWQASRAQAIDECLQLHESIKITPPDNDDWIDAIIDSREAYQQAIKQLKEQP